MKVSNSTLVIVDVQNGFVTDETRHVIPAIVELAKRWHEMGGGVVCSRYHNYEGSAFERLMDWRQVYTPPDTNLVPELSGHANHSTILDKYSYSALTPELIDLTVRKAVTDLIICGIDTDLCVLKTALDAFEHGLTPWVVTNASASTGGSSAHNAALMVLGRGIGEYHLVTSEELFSRVVAPEWDSGEVGAEER